MKLLFSINKIYYEKKINIKKEVNQENLALNMKKKKNQKVLR